MRFFFDFAIARAQGVVDLVRRAIIDAEGDDLPGQAVGRPGDVGAARRVFNFVVGEGGVDERLIRSAGQDALAVGVVFSCSGTRKVFGKKVKNTGYGPASALDSNDLHVCCTIRSMRSRVFGIGSRWNCLT